ncbi:DUF4301 family protein [Maribacter halichondriae]|uniref:DUF4301 family protein n=1 Tax=Maribacter halichondriae TaxID=2980554 RepID=UPI0030761F11
MSQITSNDQRQLSEKGISKEKVLDQIEIFKEGIPFVRLEKAGVVDGGILKFTDDEEQTLIEKFESDRSRLSLLKFVPASGAASRMFKALFNFWIPMTLRRKPWKNIYNARMMAILKSSLTD